MLASALPIAIRAASLNLCTDEYLMLLARPDQISSISYLSQDSNESPLWRQARRHRANHGALEDVVALRPTLLLTMGGGGRASAMIARRMRLRTLDLASGRTIDDVAENVRRVAAALGQPDRATPLLTRLRRLRLAAPARRLDTIWLGGGGLSLAPGGLGATWLGLAGFRQRALPDQHATFETLLTAPPKVLIQSIYRSGQMSGGAAWLANPIVRNARARHLTTDGRPWTCLGPLMIPEIERLRRARI